MGVGGRARRGGVGLGLVEVLCRSLLVDVEGIRSAFWPMFARQGSSFSWGVE
jgi:hypothetical protein